MFFHSDELVILIVFATSCLLDCDGNKELDLELTIMFTEFDYHLLS